jgi:hypothetical protein
MENALALGEHRICPIWVAQFAFGFYTSTILGIATMVRILSYGNCNSGYIKAKVYQKFFCLKG